MLPLLYSSLLQRIADHLSPYAGTNMYFGSGIVSIIGPAFAYIPVITASLGKMMVRITNTHIRSMSPCSMLLDSCCVFHQPLSAWHVRPATLCRQC